MIACEKCHGTGETSIKCTRCTGKGPQYNCPICGNSGIEATLTCNACEGTGEQEECSRCEGAGVVEYGEPDPYSSDGVGFHKIPCRDCKGQGRKERE